MLKIIKCKKNASKTMDMMVIAMDNYEFISYYLFIPSHYSK